jgi:predicted CoA-substrate-specific enzyme activase
VITAGVDIGSLFTKAVVIDDETPLGSGMIRTSAHIDRQAPELLREVIRRSGLSPDRIDSLGVTGNGADLYPDADFAEDTLVCLGAAAAFYLPGARFCLDLGGQSITTFALGPEGEVVNFLKNDKCASGSGRFLEMMSEKLETPLEEVDAAVARSTRAVTISNQCGVFAESEVISLVNSGQRTADVMAAVCASVARMVIAQAGRLGVAGPYTMTGGVARIEAVASAVRRGLGGDPLRFPYDPQLAAALGAALLGDPG